MTRPGTGFAATKRLGQLLLRPPRYGINAPAVPLFPGLPTYLRITDITSDGRFAPDPPVGVDHPQSSSYQLSEGELVFARTGASVGKSYIYDPADGELVYAGFLINIAPDPTLLNPYFLFYFTQSKAYWDWIARMSVRSGQPGVNGNEYAQLPIPLPDIAEQNAIARVLSDTDDLIETLDAYIAKKRDIKTAVMQQLFSGKHRLASANQPWTNMAIGLLGETFGGLSGKTKEDFRRGTARYFSFLQVIRSPVQDGEGLPVVMVSDGEVQNKVRPGDILFNGSSETPDELAIASYVREVPQEATYLNSFCFGLRLSATETTDALYLTYYFRSPSGRKLVASLAQGATRYNMAKSQFKSLVVPLPPLEEQRKIVQIVSDIDAEIEVLEQRRDKMKGIKMALMHDLLTGRRRLSDDYIRELNSRPADASPVEPEEVLV